MNTTTGKKHPNYFLKVALSLLGAVLVIASYTVPQMLQSARAESLRFITQQQDPEIPTKTPTKRPVLATATPTFARNQTQQKSPVGEAKTTKDATELCNETLEAMEAAPGFGWGCSDIYILEQDGSLDNKAELSDEIDIQEKYEVCTSYLTEQLEFAVALNCYTEVINADPYFAGAYYQRSIAAFHLGMEPDTILEDLNTSIDLKPDFAKAYYQRFRVLFRLKGEESIADLDKAIELEPDYFDAIATRGVVKNNTWKWEEALGDLSIAIDIKPDDARPEAVYSLYFNRGIARYNLKLMDDAITDFTEAIKYYPGSLEAYFNRGITYIAIGNVDALLADIERVLALEPSYAVNLEPSLPRLNELLGNYTTLDDHYTRLEKLIGDVNSQVTLAKAATPEPEVTVSPLITKYYERPIRLFTEMINTNPDDISARLGRIEPLRDRAITFADTGNKTRAEEDTLALVRDLNKVLELDPSFTVDSDDFFDIGTLSAHSEEFYHLLSILDPASEAFRQYAEVLNKVGKEESLDEAVQKAIENAVPATATPTPDPNRSKAEQHFDKGMEICPESRERIICRDGDAEQEFNKAIELNPEFAEAYYARSHLTLRRTPEDQWRMIMSMDQVTKDLLKAIELKPDYAEAYHELARIQIEYERDQKKEALENLNKAIELKPDYYDAYVTRADLHSREKRPDDAIADYAKAIAVIPTDMDIFDVYRSHRQYERYLFYGGRLRESLVENNNVIDLYIDLKEIPPEAGKGYNRNDAHRDILLLRSELKGALAKVEPGTDDYTQIEMVITRIEEVTGVTW